MDIKIKSCGAKELAKRSRGTPRIALRLLRRTRDFLEVSNNELIDKSFADMVLGKLGIDKLGLDKMDAGYLSFILKNYQNSAVGIKTIASAVSEKEDCIEEIIEPYLIKIGFIDRTPRGRKLTQKALDHLLQ